MSHAIGRGDSTAPHNASDSKRKVCSKAKGSTDTHAGAWAVTTAEMTLNSWTLWAGAAALMAAATAVLAKLGVQGLDANLATLVRTLVVAAALTVLLLANGQLQLVNLQEAPRTSLIALGLSGIATGVSWLCYFQALKLGPVSRVASIDKLSVVLVALFGVFLLGERLSAAAWLGVVLMAGGAALVALA